MRLAPITLAVLIAIGADAVADPVDELRLAANVQLGELRIGVGDTRSARDHLLSKPSGSLDLAIPASLFDPSLSFTIRLRGTKIGPGLVRWTFDETLSPPLPVDDNVDVTRFEGVIVGAVWRIPAALTPECAGVCKHGVSIHAAPGTWGRIHLTTSQGSQKLDVTDIRLSAYGGFPRPALDRIVINNGAPICASSVEKLYAGAITLATPASPSGAIVPIASSHPSKVRVHGVLVPAGQTSTPVELAVTAQWTGAATFTAVSGGIERTATVNVISCPK